MKTAPSYAGIQRYSQRTFGVNFESSSLTSPLKGKSYSPLFSLKLAFTSLLCGRKSARSIQSLIEDVAKKIGKKSIPARNTVGKLLGEQRVADWLEANLLNGLDVAKRLRVHKPVKFQGKIIATLDGYEFEEVHKGGGNCDYCLKRTRDGKDFYFHRVVVLNISTEYGPLPIAVRFAEAKDYTVELDSLSDSEFKTTSELGTAKALLIELAKKCGGKLPFDILGADALYANAVLMELVESLGSTCCFVYKQENRTLHKAATADFNKASLAFNVKTVEWDNDPNNRDRKFITKSSIYIDINREGENKNVKIFETTRTEADGKKVRGMAITSDVDFINPQMVEAIRFAKWSDTENKSFNNLTTKNETADHIFYHNKNAIFSMFALQLLVLGISNFYKIGNLTRGGRKFLGTIKDFFDSLLSSFKYLRIRALEIYIYNLPPP